MRNSLLKILCFCALILSANLNAKNAGGDPAFAGEDQTICDDSTGIAGNEPLGFDGLWTLISGSGSINDDTSFETYITGLALGENVFVWEFYSSSVLQSSDTLRIFRNEAPIISAGIDQDICGDSTQLNASTSAGTGLWQIISGSGTLSDENSAQSDLTALTSGTTELEWSVTIPGCSTERDTVFITVTEAPTISAGTDQDICGDSTQLNASTSAGTGIWQIISGSGTPK